MLEGRLEPPKVWNGRALEVHRSVVKKALDKIESRDQRPEGITELAEDGIVKVRL